MAVKAQGSHQYCTTKYFPLTILAMMTAFDWCTAGFNRVASKAYDCLTHSKSFFIVLLAAQKWVAGAVPLYLKFLISKVWSSRIVTMPDTCTCTIA